MAVNEKTVYATEHTTFGGKLFRPGEQMSGRVPDYVISSALESGVASDAASRAESARKAESARQADVAARQDSRSEKRESNKR